MLWVPALRRWLVVSELAAASGFPVRSDFARRAGTSTDDVTLSVLQKDINV